MINGRWDGTMGIGMGMGMGIGIGMGIGTMGGMGWDGNGMGWDGSGYGRQVYLHVRHFQQLVVYF